MVALLIALLIALFVAILLLRLLHRLPLHIAGSIRTTALESDDVVDDIARARTAMPASGRTGMHTHELRPRHGATLDATTRVTRWRLRCVLGLRHGWRLRLCCRQRLGDGLQQRTLRIRPGTFGDAGDRNRNANSTQHRNSNSPSQHDSHDSRELPVISDASTLR